MPTMKAVQTAGPGAIDVVEAERPVPGPRDVLIRVRACGTCGTDATFVHLGGLPAGPDGQTRPIPHGHEPAGEIIEAGAAVTGLKPGDRAGASPQAAPSAALRGGRANEPMAVARHCVNRAQADPADKAVVSGAGPIGLGASVPPCR